MAQDPFTSALRAEIEALVTRYEALSHAHQEALSVAREQDVSKLRQDLGTLLADRERTRSQLDVSRERIGQLERELSEIREQFAMAAGRIETLQIEIHNTKKERDQIQRQLDEALLESTKVEATLRDSQQETTSLRQQLDEAHRKITQIEASLRNTQQEADSLSEAFSSERAFISACQRLEGTMLYDALQQAFQSSLTHSPSTYATIKARRPDAILTAAFKERGRLIAAAPLSPTERAPLAELAEASGCELIEPERGSRFSSQQMDKALTQPDPAEEGNILECLMPGLRLTGTEGALLFPRVLVATG